MDFEKNIQNISKISALENKEDRVGRVELESTWDQLIQQLSRRRKLLVQAPDVSIHPSKPKFATAG